MSLRRKVPFAAALTTAVLTIAGPAFAEGSFTSYMRHWLPGLETRDWDDKNTDDVGTKFGARDCHYDVDEDVKTIAMELNRNDTWTPDEHYGTKTIACNNTTVTTVSWGDKGKGNFDMTLKKVDGQVSPGKGHLNVDYVKVSY